MKYKGVTLFSTALILLGSVGTATVYIANNPTNVTAKEIGTSGSAPLLGGNTVISNLLSEGASEGAVTKVEDGYEIGYSVRNDADDSKLSAANPYLTGISKVTENDDGSYTVSMEAQVSKSLDSDPKIPLLQITSINGETDIPVTIHKDIDTSGNVVYDFNFKVDKLNSLVNDIPVDFIITLPAALNFPTMYPSAKFKFDALDLAKAIKAKNPDADVTDILKSGITDLQNRLAAIQDDAATEKKNLDGKVANLNEQLSQLKLDKNASDNKVQSLTEQVSKLEDNKKDLETQQENLKTQITELTDKISKLTTDGTTSTDALTEAKTALEKIKTAKDAVDKQLDTLQTTADELKTKLKEALADANAADPVDVKDETDSNKTSDDASDDIADEYQVPYVVNKTGTNTASLSSEYFTKTAYVTKNSDGKGYSVEIQMQYPLAYTENGVAIKSVSGKDIDQSTVKTTSDDNNYVKSFQFNIDELSDLNDVTPVTMSLDIPNAITATESADLVFNTAKLPINEANNNTSDQVLGSGSDTGSGTGTTSTATTGTAGTTGTTGTTSSTGTTSGTLPQTDAKGLPTYIMYAGFIILAVTLAGAGKVKFTGKK